MHRYKSVDSVPLMSEPIELPWPPYTPCSQSTTTSYPLVLRLKWKDMHDEQHVFPNILVLFDLPGPCGVPGRVVLHSDVILRNLLPIELQANFSVHHTPFSDTVSHLQAPNSVIRIPNGPSEQFFSTYSRSSLPPHWISVKFCAAHNHELDATNSPDTLVHSDPFLFCIPTPTSDGQKRCTSLRSLISISTTSLCDEVVRPDSFFCIVTVEFRVFNPSAPVLNLITISPVFFVVNQIPLPFNLDVRSAHSFSSHPPGPVRVHSRPGLPPIVPVPSADRSPVCLTDDLQGVTFPEIIVTPFRAVKSPHVIMTALLSDTSPLLPEPIHLTPETILSRLSATFASVTQTYGSFTPDYQLSQQHGSLSMKTYGLRYPIHRLKQITTTVQSADAVNDVIPLTCYTLRVLIRPERRIFNASGINLMVHFSAKDHESVVLALADQSQIILPNMKPIIHLGCTTDRSTSWSSFGFMLDEAKPGSRPNVNGSSITCTAPCVFDLVGSTDPLELVSLDLPDTLGHTKSIPVGGFLRLNIQTESSVIFLLVRRLNQSEPSESEVSSLNEVILIESLLSVRCPVSSSLRITPVAFPVCDNPKGILSPVPISELHQYSYISGKMAKCLPLPCWFLSHPELHTASGFQLGGCLLISTEYGISLVSALLHSLVTIFDTSRWNDTFDTSTRVQLLSIPSDGQYSFEKHLIVVLPSPSETGKVIIELLDISSDPKLLPTALRVMNTTNMNLAVDVCDSQWSVLDKKQHVSWQSALLGAQRILNARDGMFVWIPESTLKNVYVFNDPVSDTGASPFLIPSMLTGVLLIFGYGGNGEVIRVDLGTLLTNDAESTVTLSESTTIYISVCRDVHLGTSVLLSCEHQPLVLESLTTIHPLASCYFTCDQLFFSLLICKPLWHPMTRFSSRLYPHQPFSQPPEDEFIRLVLSGFHLSSHLTTFPGIMWDLNVRVLQMQLDNWAQKWTHAYDFPVLLRSTSPSVLCVRIQSPNSNSFFSSTVYSAFVYPPQLDFYLEDNALRDISVLLMDYWHAFSDPQASHVPSAHLDSCLRPFYLQRLYIASYSVHLTLRATLRMYLSCHEAPVTFKAFNLHSAGYKRDGNGYALRVESLLAMLSTHYLSELFFRAGWLVGSLDMLGNVTGLLNSLTNGLRDLIRMRRTQATNHLTDSFLVGHSVLDKPKAAVSLVMNTTSGGEFVMVSGDPPEQFIHNNTTSSLQSPTSQTASPLSSILEGLTSLNRHATGGLLRSVTGVAASIARNLDYLTLDAQHRELQEYARRKQLPRGFTESFQQALNGLGLCLLSAIAGIADHPLQALFQVLDGPEQEDLSVNRPSNVFHPSLMWTALGGLGRGLVGAVVKPIAGMAEFVAQTGTGLLRSNDLDFIATALEQVGGPYSSSLGKRALRHVAVDTTVLRTWAFRILQELHTEPYSIEDRSHQNVTSPTQSQCFPTHPILWMTTAVLEEVGNRDAGTHGFNVLWLVCDGLSSLHVAYAVDDGGESRMNIGRVSIKDALSCLHPLKTVASPGECRPTQQDAFLPIADLLFRVKLSLGARCFLSGLSKLLPHSSLVSDEPKEDSSGRNHPTAPGSSSTITEEGQVERHVSTVKCPRATASITI